MTRRTDVAWMGGSSRPDARVVLDAIAFAVVVTDGTGVVTGWNRASEVLFGWSAAEAVGEPITDLIVFESESDIDAATSANAGAARAGESACRRKDGARIWVHSTLSPIVEHGRVVAMVRSCVDISKRRATNIRIGSLLRHASNVAFIVNVDGTFKYVSPDFERAFGLERGALLGQVGYDFVHPDDRPEVARAIAVAVADPSEHPVVVYRGRTEAGAWDWRELIATNMLDEPEIGGVVLNVRDVSEREEALADLRNSEARFRSLFEHANDVGFLTGIDGCIRYVTPSLFDILGYRPEEIVGRRTWDSFGVAVSGSSVSSLVSSLAAPGDRVDFTATLRAADGSLKWVEMTVRNLTDNPAVDGFVTNLRDVTDRMEAFAALRSSEARQRGDRRPFQRAHDLLRERRDRGVDEPGGRRDLRRGPGRARWVQRVRHDPSGRSRSRPRGVPNDERGRRSPSHPVPDARLCGRVRWVDEVVTNLIDDPDVGCFVGNVRDITDQHLAADALAASEARYRSIVETAQEGIWVTESDGSTVFANATMARMLGTDGETLERQPLASFLAVRVHTRSWMRQHATKPDSGGRTAPTCGRS